MPIILSQERKSKNVVNKLKATNRWYDKPYLWWAGLPDKKKGKLIRKYGQNISAVDLYNKTH